MVFLYSFLRQVSRGFLMECGRPGGAPDGGAERPRTTRFVQASAARQAVWIKPAVEKIYENTRLVRPCRLSPA